MDGTIEIITAVISAAATIWAAWGAKRYWKNKNRDPVVEDTAQSANIYTALKYMLGEVECDRAYVMQFHNGGHYYSGRGQQKFSCTHEVTTKGITKQCSISQEHRVSHYHDYITQLLTDGKFAHDTLGAVEDHNFAQILKQAGVKSIYNVPFTTLNGRIIGILGVDYVKSEAPQARFGKEAQSFMKGQARIMAGYLL